jgi:hypothetical protein
MVVNNYQIIKFNMNSKEKYPVIVYNNAEIDKSRILKENKDKSGIYR